ncbi:corticotropin-releasing factor receptor 1 [Nephila pilipes]|uniref:Corticotropin-releasing factor receptor 1 n=3 Tax=Nephila pilipes TaxID=299642 RepID=A0A8X6PH45_NEPPI|nr:corticotropin-releasing factor receptor 1 [Nephila pilipes]
MTERLCNETITDPFCAAVWDSFICWPPLSPGEVMSKPCPQMNTKGIVIGDATHPGMFAVRSCAENGSWVENRTNFSLCITNMATLYPSSWTPTIVASIVVIGSIVSIITLSVTLFIFCYFNCLKCSRLKVHRNLSIALLLHLLLLIVTSSPVLLNVSYKHTEWLCKSVLILQMYSGMASINWMFVEGLLLHSRVTVHIFKQDAPFKLYYCIGWGIPALCIGSWCSLMYLYHNTPCWSGYGDLPYIWVITGPMLAALLVNSVFLVDIIRVLVTKRHANFGGEANQVRCALYDGLPQQKYCPWPHAQPSVNACGRKKAIKATALLFPLLGIPHLLFCINPKDNGKLEEAYMIVNAFIKSSQGLFVSVLYCFMNNDVQTALRKAYMRAIIRRNPNHRYTCRTRGMSQTSGTYLSHSDGNILGGDSAGRHKIATSRTVLRLQDHPVRSDPKSRPEFMTVIF